MAIGEHYSLKLFGSILSQQFLNTFAYRQTAGVAPGEAGELIAQWESWILANLAGNSGDYVAYNRVECFSIEDPVDYADVIPGFPTGGRAILTANQPPSYTAWAYRSNRAGAGTRSSYKRFCGLSEDDSDANSLTGVFLARAQTLALSAELAATRVAPSGNTWVPVQLQSGWVPGFAPVENFQLTAFGVPYLTSQVSRRA